MANHIKNNTNTPKKHLAEGMKPPWPKGVSGNPKGRPPLLVKQILKDFKDAGIDRLTKLDVIESIEILFNSTDQKIKEVAQDENAPIFIRIAARHMIKAGNRENVFELLLSRAYGKPQQDITSDGEKIGDVVIKFVQHTDKPITSESDIKDE